MLIFCFWHEWTFLKNQGYASNSCDNSLLLSSDSSAKFVGSNKLMQFARPKMMGILRKKMNKLSNFHLSKFLTLNKNNVFLRMGSKKEICKSIFIWGKSFLYSQNFVSFHRRQIMHWPKKIALRFETQIIVYSHHL